MCCPSACRRRGRWAGGDGAAWWRWRETGKSAREENWWRLALRGGLHALLTSHDSESNQPGRSTRIACFYQALVSHWILLVSRWIRLASTNQEEAHGSCFLSSACEPLDQACRMKPSMVQFVHEVHPVFVVALSTVLASSTDVALSKKIPLYNTC